MATIKVHLFNFHGLFSHSEIVLENLSTQPHVFYNINRWATPQNAWSTSNQCSSLIKQAKHMGAVFSFEIQASPEEITKKWNDYWSKTSRKASIFSENCAVASQWFLREFAQVPNSNFSNISANHLALGLQWPSFIPCPITLPGRVMSNAKFHINHRQHPERLQKYSHLALYTGLACSILVLGASILALVLATTILTGGIALIAGIAATAIGLGIASSVGLFSTYNMLSAKKLYDASPSSSKSSAQSTSSYDASESFPSMATAGA